LNRTDDGTVTRIPVSITLSTGAASLEITTPASKSKSTTMYSDATIAWNIVVNNTGDYPATSCNCTATSELSPFTSFDSSDFSIAINESKTISVTYSEASAGSYSGTIVVSCSATPEGGIDTDIVNPIDVNVLQSADPPAGGGGGATTTVIQNITGGPVCGDGECEEGETAFSCPLDCAGLNMYNIFSGESSILKIMFMLLIGGVMYQYYVTYTKKKKKYKDRKNNYNWKKW